MKKKGDSYKKREKGRDTQQMREAREANSKDEQARVKKG